MHRLRIHFETTHFCHAYVNKRLDILDKLQNLHLYTEKPIGATSIRHFEEVGGKFPLKLSSQTHFC